MAEEVFRDVRRWCEHQVDAEDTSVIDGRDGVHCRIRDGDDEVHIDITDDNRGNVQIHERGSRNDEPEHGWSGNIETLDLHESGLTVADEHASFSVTWDR